MSKLIYLSYPLMDKDTKPDWVEKIKVNPMVQKEHWALYDPMLGFSGNFESGIYMAAFLSDNTRLSEHAKANQKELRLDPALFGDLGTVLRRVKESDERPSIDLPFKNLYVLLRSDIMLVDLNDPDHGERSQEVLYAYLFGVPVVGVAHRFILSPWVAGKVSAVVFPATTDEIVAQVLAYDYKTTAAFKYIRSAKNESRELESRKGVLEAARELRENVQGAVDDMQEKRAQGKVKKEPGEDGGRKHTGDESASSI
jgi:hypothetical protein